MDSSQPSLPWRAAHAALAQSTLGDMMASGNWTPAEQLLTLRASATVGEALALLAAGRVLSAPLLASDGAVAGVAETRAAAVAFLRAYDAQAEAADAGALAPDVAAAICAEAARRAADDVARRSAAEAMLPEAEPPPLLRLSGYGAQTPLVELVRRALLHQQPPVSEAAARHAAVVASSMPGGACERPRHRVLLTTAAGGPDGHADALLGLVSGSDVARFLADKLPPEAMAAPLAAFGLPPAGRAPPRRARLAAPAIDALRTMLEGDGVAAQLAVDDDSDNTDASIGAAPPLAACFSHSDLRALAPHDFGLLALPLGEFLVLQKALAEAPRAAGLSPAMDAAEAASSQEAPPRRDAPPFASGRVPGWRAALRAAAPLVALRRDATLAQALAAMRQHRVHRVFISSVEGGDNTLPDAMVSITDILRALADGPPAGAFEGFNTAIAAALDSRINDFTNDLLSRLPPAGYWSTEEGKALMKMY